MPAYRIQSDTRHKSAEVLAGYIREADKWTKSGLDGSMAWGFEAALNKSQLNSCIGALDRFVAQAILRFMSTREVPKNSSVMIRNSPEMRKAIDDFRGQLRPIPTAAQVVRDAIQQYLKRQQQAAKQKTG